MWIAYVNAFVYVGKVHMNVFVYVGIVYVIVFVYAGIVYVNIMRKKVREWCVNNVGIVYEISDVMC